MEALPKDCIEAILSRTTPSDVCRLSSVSKAFYSAAYSNAVWDAFFPSSFSFVTLSHDAPFKKALYLALSQQPIIINDNKMSFQLDRKTGKKCYMLSARSLDILWDDSDLHWKWLYMPGSRILLLSWKLCENLLSPVHPRMPLAAMASELSRIL